MSYPTKWNEAPKETKAPTLRFNFRLLTLTPTKELFIEQHETAMLVRQLNKLIILGSYKSWYALVWCYPQVNSNPRRKWSAKTLNKLTLVFFVFTSNIDKEINPWKGKRNRKALARNIFALFPQESLESHSKNQFLFSKQKTFKTPLPNTQFSRFIILEQQHTHCLTPKRKILITPCLPLPRNRIS